ncbi:hypothetical protein PR202_ga11633 [Eleusine coracana subsp. coracana]|uniref:Uncharacterized protein n=1 Tax=Eleusine coracana subsp. coracana TaxID=191504 RepID=A0AAV5C9E7_ELECO|nr:hypothetical protein PR202_ga11633 [Eleusine coracana subsp. coracana]
MVVLPPSKEPLSIVLAVVKEAEQGGVVLVHCPVERRSELPGDIEIHYHMNFCSQQAPCIADQKKIADCNHGCFDLKFHIRCPFLASLGSPWQGLGELSPHHCRARLAAAVTLRHLATDQPTQIACLGLLLHLHPFPSLESHRASHSNSINVALPGLVAVDAMAQLLLLLDVVAASLLVADSRPCHTFVSFPAEPNPMGDGAVHHHRLVPRVATVVAVFRLGPHHLRHHQDHRRLHLHSIHANVQIRDAVAVARFELFAPPLEPASPRFSRLNQRAITAALLCPGCLLQQRSYSYEDEHEAVSVEDYMDVKVLRFKCVGALLL